MTVEKSAQAKCLGIFPKASEVMSGQLEQRYDQLSFSGGGLRCFWQGGALEVLGKNRTLAPKRIAAASGGALAAACFISGRGGRLLEAFRTRLEKPDRNVRPNTALDGRNITPHEAIYSEVVADVLDAEACETVAEGPQFEVLLASPPGWLPLAPAVALTMALYEADKFIRSTPHGGWAQAAGARELRIDGRQAAREGKLVELVCKAAIIPPIFDVKSHQGKLVMDAGVLDNAPVPTGDAGNTLVLLTRSYRNLPAIEGRTYLFPSHATEADKIDFTDPQALEATYAQGKKDLEALISQTA